MCLSLQRGAKGLLTISKLALEDRLLKAQRLTQFLIINPSIKVIHLDPRNNKNKTSNI
jgi:hypothetical protein